MRKLIDIPEEEDNNILEILELLADESHMKVKTYIEKVLIDHANKNKNRVK